MLHQNQLIQNENGDCLRACLANLLEYPIARVPHFLGMEGKAGEWDVWWLELQSWLKQRGYFFLVMALPENVPWYEIPYEAPCIFMGKTQKGVYHAVIGEVGKDGKSWKILHDPLVGSSGVAALESLGFLVPLEPWKKYKGSDDFLDFLTPEEVKALNELATKQELRPTVVLRQALRHYQAHILGAPELPPKFELIRNPEYDKATHQLCTAPNCVPNCPICGDHESQCPR